MWPYTFLYQNLFPLQMEVVIMPTIDINYWAVLVAAFASYVIGALWYSPLLFGKAWMELMGFTEKDMQDAKKKGMAKKYGIMFVSTLVMSYVLAHVVDYTESTTVIAGAQAGFWIWLGFIAPVSLGSVLWEGKSWTLWLINASYYLVVLLIMGAVLAVWA